MMFIADADELAEAAAYVAGAVMSQPPNPALAGIQVSVDGPDDNTDQADGRGVGRLMLSATDTQTYQRAGFEVGLTSPDHRGSVIVSGSMLAAITKSLPAGEVVGTVVEGRLELRMKRSVYRVPIITEPFPADPERWMLNGGFHVVPAPALAQALAAVRHCVNDQSLHAPGVVLDMHPVHGLRVTAMSSSALTTVTTPWGATFTEEATQSVVALGLLEAAVHKPVGDIIGLGLNDGHIVVAQDGRDAQIRTFVESKAKLWQRSLEGEAVGSILADSAELLKALRRIPLAMLPNERELAGAAMAVVTEGGASHITLVGRDKAAIEYIECKVALAKKPIDVSLTVGLLADVLATCGGREVSIEFRDRRLIITDATESVQATHMVVLRREM